MAFHDVRFDTGISYGSSFGVSRNVRVLELPSGEREATARWTRSLRRFNVGYGIKGIDDLLSVRRFYQLRGGPLNEFRFKDFSDFTSSSDDIGTEAQTDQQIGVGDGSETVFQLIKIYTDGTYNETRPITKPVSGTVVIDDIGGVPQVESTHFTVDYTTGLVTFTTAPGVSNAIKAGYQFDVPVSFGSELEEVLELDYTSFQAGRIPEILMTEVLTPDPLPDETHHGGAINHGTLGADFSMSLTAGRSHRVTPSTSIDAILPDTTTLPTGGPLFFITNDHASNALEVYTFGKADLVTTLSGTAGLTRQLILSYDSAGDKEWQVF